MHNASMQILYNMHMVEVISELTRSVWCSWANSAETRSFRDTTSRKFPHNAISREHSCAKFIFTSSANSSGLSALCCKITYIYIYKRMK